MYRIKHDVIACTIIILNFCGCNSGIKKLPNIYGKKLSTPQGHLFSPRQLYIYGDSTFQYTEGGPALKYTKGKWIKVDKSRIALKSINQIRQEKELRDTVFLDFDSMVVRIRGKNKVEMNNQLFIYRD